jgi:hypothetical protein
MSNDINLTDGTVLEVLNDKVDIDFQNVPSNSVGFARCSTEITNCITEIPQRIKLELKNGVLTLKAGSEVIVPNGFEEDGTTPKFDYMIVENDVTSTGFTGYTFTPPCFYVPSLNILIFDGEYTGTGTNGYQYDTTTNKLAYKGTTSQAGLENATLSYPIGLINMDATIGIKSIAQVFNGMGYIGSTIWCDKGVKILIPNGRNEDGTLKNTEYICPILITASSTATLDYVIRLGAAGSLPQRQQRYSLTVKTLEDLYKLNVNTSYYVHVTDENFTYFTSNGEWKVATDVPIATATLTQGVVSNFQPKQPFRAVNYDDVVLKNSLTEAQVVVQTYKNGASWYRVWSDGWIEQGGYSSSMPVTVTLLKAFSNTNYTVQATMYSNNNVANYENVAVTNRTVNGFKIYQHTINNQISWYACGY